MFPAIRITKLFLSNYRNHKQLKIKINKKIIVLYGDNGAGKTNVLEAISLISSNSGFRNAKLSSLINRTEKFNFNNFGINLEFSYLDNLYNVGIGLEKKSGTFKKIIKFNDQKIQSRMLQEKIKIFWILPTMINLFIGPASERRDFLDSMISTFDDIYYKTLSSYKNYQKERIKILKKFHLSSSTEKWLLSIEKKISSLGIIICDSRRLFIEKLNEYTNSNVGKIPSIIISLSGDLDQQLLSYPALTVEESFLERLKNNRQIDMITGRTNYGINRTDLKIFDKNKAEYSENCSTGEQKVLLLSVLFLYIQILKEKKSTQIVCLLDDIFSYLDKKFINIVLEELINLKIQTWISNVNDKFIDNNSKFFDDIMFLNIADI